MHQIKTCLLFLAVPLVALLPAAAQEPSGGSSSAGKSPSAGQLIDKANRFLDTAQSTDGSWSSGRSPGVTGIVITGMLRTGRSPDQPTVARGLKNIESLINAREGHIAGKDPRVQLKNYVTSVNVMALTAAKQEDKYRKVIADAAAFLKQLQWDEAEGKQPGDDFYGGAGYDSQSRPDLSNQQFFLDALKDAGIPSTDPAVQKALVFVSRCQNLKGEHNDQPWAGKINDGSFIYSAAAGGQTKADTLPNGGLVGYGSMTYAGIKSMIYCGVSRDDPRIKKAWEWIRNNYTLDANPGMPRQYAQRGLYYYYHTMAKTLHTMGVDEVVDAQGRKHDWRADLVAALAKRQQADGSWVNQEDRWMEGDPNLVTGYVLLTLSYCQPKTTR